MNSVKPFNDVNTCFKRKINQNYTNCENTVSTSEDRGCQIKLLKHTTSKQLQLNNCLSVRHNDWTWKQNQQHETCHRNNRLEQQFG